MIQNLVINYKTLQCITTSIKTNKNSTYNTKQTQYVTTKHSNNHNNTTI